MQKIETIKLSQVKVNSENPRTISGDKFQKLVNSILVFPKMLEIRPVVINKEYKALGGNMRTNALNYIAKMDKAQCLDRLHTQADYQKMTSGEKRILDEYWNKWLTDPTIQIIKAEKLSPDEQKQFIVKDNVQFGTWDYDALANKFEAIDLGNWGMDVWQPTDFGFTPNQPSAPSGVVPTVPAASEDDSNNNPFEGQLPPELQGQDLTPADLPKLEGSDETAMERIIIVYRKDQAEQLMNLIGLTSIDKVVYNINEILPEE